MWRSPCQIPARGSDLRICPYLRALLSTKTHGQGNGLGLSQVFGFAEQSGGDISVSSTEGQGASFTLYLPRTDVVQASSAVRTRDADGHTNQGTVLIVDDNPDVREFAVHMLVELGYDTVEVEDGPSAIEALGQSAGGFGLVFSDVMMPEMTGIELGHEIRRLYPDLPVILASGYSDAVAEQGPIEFELLSKPYSLEQLSRTVGQLFRRHISIE